MTKQSVLFFMAALMIIPATGWPQAEIIELSCPSCGYRERFVQGSDARDLARNVQQVIVVCERSRDIRTIRVALDPRLPVDGEPLLARQYGTGTSKFLGLEIPKFMVPGNTCPLFPITAYLEANICPIDGRPGIQYGIVGQY